jgi:hypothetical protein
MKKQRNPTMGQMWPKGQRGLAGLMAKWGLLFWLGQPTIVAAMEARTERLGQTCFGVSWPELSPGNNDCFVDGRLGGTRGGGQALMGEAW